MQTQSGASDPPSSSGTDCHGAEASEAVPVESSAGHGSGGAQINLKQMEKQLHTMLAIAHGLLDHHAQSLEHTEKV